jgi:hypothetical protein
MCSCAGYLGYLFVKIGDLGHTTNLPSCIAFSKKCSCPKIDHGQPLFNAYAGGYLGKQAEGWRLLLVRGRKTG